MLKDLDVLNNLGVNQVVVVYDQKVYITPLSEIEKVCDIFEAIDTGSSVPSVPVPNPDSYMCTKGAAIFEIYKGLNKYILLMYLTNELGLVYNHEPKLSTVPNLLEFYEE